MERDEIEEHQKKQTKKQYDCLKHLTGEKLPLVFCCLRDIVFLWKKKVRSVSKGKIGKRNERKNRKKEWKEK